MSFRKRSRESPAGASSSPSGHAVISTFLAGATKTIKSDKCWWRNSGEQQSRHHHFVKCRAWEAQITELWKGVGKSCEWKHPQAPTVRLHFNAERATPASCSICETRRSKG